MSRSFSRCVLLATALIAAACGGTKTIEIEQRAENDIQPPKWWLKPPQDERFIYAAATSTSQDLQIAVDKATIQSREELVKQLELRLRTIESNFEEETGFMSDAEIKTTYKSAVNATVERTLLGSHLKDKYVVREGNLWRAYVLTELPVDDIHKAMIEEINANEILRDKLGTTKTFKELGG